MDFLNQREAADLLRVSERTIKRYRASGELPFLKVGNGVRFRREHLERLMKPGMPTAAVPPRSWIHTRHRDADELPANLLRPVRRSEFAE